MVSTENANISTGYILLWLDAPLLFYRDNARQLTLGRLVRINAN